MIGCLPEGYDFLGQLLQESGPFFMSSNRSRGSLQSTYEKRLEGLLTFGPVDQKWTRIIIGKDTLKRAT